MNLSLFLKFVLIQQILRFPSGWYILFSNDIAAPRSKSLLDHTAVNGHQITMTLKEPLTGRKPLEQAASAMNGNAGEKGWRFLTIAKKNKPTQARRASPPTPPRRGRRRSFTPISDEEDLPRKRAKPAPSFSSSSALSDEEVLAVPTKPKQIRESHPSGDEVSTTVPVAPTPTEEGEPELEKEEAVIESKKRAAKPKLAKGSNKARLESPAVEIALVPVTEPQVAEIKLDDTEPDTKKPVKSARPRKPAPTPLEKLVAEGKVADEEDAYWLGQVLAAVEGEAPQFDEEEDKPLLSDDHPLYHTSGSWRAEGWKKIPHVQKSRYLPQRNRAAATVEDTGALTTGRTARVTGRRLALDMETHRKTAAATSESDLFAFNQLRIRKKQLRFARSAIEGYGLYAMETIHAGEMVCEYVGELVRSSVADLREHQYLRQGIGSSYLFRIDGDVVCDATFCGSVR